MCSSMESSGSSAGAGMKRSRKPLQLLTGIFSRKGRRDEEEDELHQTDEGDEELDQEIVDLEDVEVVQEGGRAVFLVGSSGLSDIWRDDDEDFSPEIPEIPEPREALHSPYHSRTIDQDMETLRLSRQDNPFLQVLASQENLADHDCCEYDEKHLMSKENLNRDPLTIAEVHARLVRSPPPVMWTREMSRNSEPSFSRLTSNDEKEKDDCIFQFPNMNSTKGCHHESNFSSSSIPNVGHHNHNHHNHHNNQYKIQSQNSNSKNSKKLLSPFDFGVRENAHLETLAGQFNLSPQPRRRPELNKNKNKTFS